MCDTYVTELNAKHSGSAKICQLHQQSDTLHRNNTMILVIN